VVRSNGRRLIVVKQFVFVRAVLVPVAGACLFAAAYAADSREPAAALAPQVDAADQAEIVKLVRELGASTFITRQHAQRRLVEFGLQAKRALETACDDPDHEIQNRARAALAAIDDVDFHVRLGAFLIADDAGDDYGLAGWPRFRSLVGAGGVARRLFADMQRGERDLLDTADRSPMQAGALLDARCQVAEGQTQGSDADRQPALSLATMAAIVFVASDRDVPVSDHAGNCINGFVNQTALTQALQARHTSAIVRGLLGAWVSRPFERDDVTGYRNLIVAMQYNLKEAVAPALALIDPPGGRPDWEQHAILAVGKLGGREHVTALLPLLDDERSTVVPDRTGRESDTQIRDVALAAMIHLTEQKLADYGFVHAKRNPLFLFNSNTLGFNDPAAREAAIKKWRAWWQAESAARR
jgi:hypothetical protein